MGAGIAEGEDRARMATEMALNSPLLNDNDVKGTTDMLLYIATGIDNEIEMDEVSEITDYIKEQTGDQCEVIWGSGQDESLGEKISITLIATGFDKEIKENKIEDTTKKVTPLNNDVAVEKPQRIEYHREEAEIEEPTIILRKEETTEEITAVKPSSETTAQKENEIQFQEITSPTLITKTSEEKEEKFEVKSENDSDKTKTVETKEEEKKFAERARKLRELSYISKSTRNIDEMENTPAYKRKNVHISHTITSKESEVARYSLGDNEGETEFKTNNSFLHDNVD
jgi:cell division protein FtsZ